MGRKLCLLPSLPPGAFSSGASLSHALCAKVISSSIDKAVIGTGLRKNYGLAHSKNAAPVSVELPLTRC